MDKEQLKEIALELLEKYRKSEETCIYEYSGSIDAELNFLEREIEDYKRKINV